MTPNPNTPRAGDFVSWDQYGPNRAGPDRGRVVAVTPRQLLDVAAECRDDPAITRRVLIAPGNVYLHRPARPSAPPTAPPPDPATSAETPARRRYVFIRRARCPDCGGADIHTYRSSRNGDSTVTRHAKCRACGVRLIVVVE